MSLLSYLKRLYSQDTLDTRFTVSSTAPLARTSSEHGIDISNPALSAAGQSAQRRDQELPLSSQPSKWATPEYFIYYLFVGIGVPWMFFVAIDVSKESDPQHPKFSPLLSAGWIPGRKVDNSDNQYSAFRDNIPYMASLVVLHPLLRKVYNSFTSVETGETAKPEVHADERLKQRVAYDLVFATIFLFALHGASALKVFLILYINFLLATKLPRAYIPAMTWIFNIGLLFANEKFDGYSYSRLDTAISGDSSWGARLDGFGGLIPRWHILFKITVLRLISFNMDYYWRLDYRAGSPVEKKQIDPSALSERDRVSTPASPAHYSFSNYVSYVLYSPLYLAGPIVNFNDYISQLRYPSPSITTLRTILYGVRFLLSLLCMEVILHYIYVVAISKSNPDWSQYTPFQLSMLGYFNLHIIWLKLLLPWRFFRLWALLDGIDPPENMVRCMSNNYSALAFWRSWHRSFNRWILRYIYIPLGGSRTTGAQTGSMLEKFAPLRPVITMLTVFTFVALWHDISTQLLAWSWLIVLFLLPEILCTHVFFPARAYVNRPNMYRYICAIGGVANVFTMMAANLVGFAIGVEGLKGLVSGIVDNYGGWVFLAYTSWTLFTAVNVMFEIRESEKRKGINLKC